MMHLSGQAALMQVPCKPSFCVRHHIISQAMRLLLKEGACQLHAPDPHVC